MVFSSGPLGSTSLPQFVTSPSILNGIFTHITLTLTLFLQESPQNIIHTFFSTMPGHQSTSPTGDCSAYHNIMAAFTGQWPQGCMTLQKYSAVVSVHRRLKSSGITYDPVSIGKQLPSFLIIKNFKKTPCWVLKMEVARSSETNRHCFISHKRLTLISTAVRTQNLAIVI